MVRVLRRRGDEPRQPLTIRPLRRARHRLFNQRRDFGFG
jgi:hypothetical protein